MNWSMIAAIAATLGVFVTFYGVIFLIRQIKDSRRFIKAQFVNELDREILSHCNVYNKFLPGGEWKKSIKEDDIDLDKVINYLGFFEKVKLLVDENTIDFPTIDKMFALRFFQIINNKIIQDAILYADELREHLTPIFALHYQWIEYRTSKSIKIPSEDNCLMKYKPTLYKSLVDQYHSH